MSRTMTCRMSNAWMAYLTWLVSDEQAVKPLSVTPTITLVLVAAPIWNRTCGEVVGLNTTKVVSGPAPWSEACPLMPLPAGATEAGLMTMVLVALNQPASKQRDVFSVCKAVLVQSSQPIQGADCVPVPPVACCEII